MSPCVKSSSLRAARCKAILHNIVELYRNPHSGTNMPVLVEMNSFFWMVIALFSRSGLLQGYQHLTPSSLSMP